MPPGPPDDSGVLTEAVYEHLRAIARRKIAQERPGHTLQATALVHEAFMRMSESGPRPEEPRFYWAAAEAMRRILIEHARAKKAVKRGGNVARADWTAFDAADLSGVENPEDFEALDGAILRLQEKDPRAADVVRLRFYAGLSVEETAAALGISPRTVKREWTYARAWLARELRDGAEP